MTSIFLDLDGVLANFDAHFPAVFGVDHRTISKPEMWAMIRSKPDFFRTIPPFDGAADFVWLVGPRAIITSVSRSDPVHVARQKREWVREYLGDIPMLPVTDGKDKAIHGQPGDILIDDHRPVCAAWGRHGGRAILHRGFAGTLERLRGMVEK